MSAVPEDFMSEPAKDRSDREPGTTRGDAEQEARAGLYQWLLIGILLACWLAEATLCAATGY